MPGTNIKYNLDHNIQPYDCADQKARVHDIDFNNISKMNNISDEQRSYLIRDADNRLLNGLKLCDQNNLNTRLTRYGIESKNKLENLIPSFAKALSGKTYFGQDDPERNK